MAKKPHEYFIILSKNARCFSQFLPATFPQKWSMVFMDNLTGQACDLNDDEIPGFFYNDVWFKQKVELKF